jgi:hypothetical protein
MPKAKKVVKKVSKKKVILPRKLSSLIGIALRDLRKAEKSDKYIISMESTFHSPTTVTCTANHGEILVKEQQACVICAAGSVMAFSLNAGNVERSPGDFVGNSAQLDAIDFLRKGNATAAAEELNITHKYEILEKLDSWIPDYDRNNPEPFHKAMIEFQAKLKKAGY